MTVLRVFSRNPRTAATYRPARDIQCVAKVATGCYTSNLTHYSPHSTGFKRYNRQIPLTSMAKSERDASAQNASFRLKATDTSLVTKSRVALIGSGYVNDDVSPEYFGGIVSTTRCGMPRCRRIALVRWCEKYIRRSQQSFLIVVHR